MAAACEARSVHELKSKRCYAIRHGRQVAWTTVASTPHSAVAIVATAIDAHCKYMYRRLCFDSFFEPYISSLYLSDSSWSSLQLHTHLISFSWRIIHILFPMGQSTNTARQWARIETSRMLWGPSQRRACLPARQGARHGQCKRMKRPIYSSELVDCDLPHAAYRSVTQNYITLHKSFSKARRDGIEETLPWICHVSWHPFRL